MKKAVLISLVLALLCTCVWPAGADSFDLSYVREHGNIYTIDVNNENEVAFVEVDLSVKNRAFTHMYESDKRYSYTHFDMLVIDYFSSSAYPVLRLWIEYSADEYLYVNSVSFILDGKEYTFTDVSDPDRRTKDENGAEETLLIKFDDENSDFLVALEDFSEKYADADDLLDPDVGAAVAMVLHGTEDVEVTLDGFFILDFVILVKGAYLECGGIGYLGQTTGTPMRVTDR